MESEKLDISAISRARIKQARKDRKMTLEQVAEKCGVQKSTVRKWEEGLIVTIKFEHLTKLSEVFHVAIAWLMGMNVPMLEETTEHKALRNKLTDKLMFYSLEDLKKLEILMTTMFD